MKDIRELFYSEGLSLYETLSTNDVIGFLVPLYQRKYSWDKKHISRLLEDILDGIMSIKQDKEAINFIGAAIFVEISVEAFRTKSSSIVDGQQKWWTPFIGQLRDEVSALLSYPRETSNETEEKIA